MNIAPAMQGLSVQSPQSGNSLPQTQKTSPAEATADTTSSAKKVDLRNASLDEINALIKSGRTELLDVVPFIPMHVLEQYNYDPESIGNHRVDLLGQVEKSIAFKNGVGESAVFLEKVLENLRNIDGSYLPTKINVTV